MLLRRLAFIGLSSLAVIGHLALAQCNSNDSTAPCFANNPDILNGRNSLLQDDDITWNVFTGGGNGLDLLLGYNGLTADSQIVQHVGSDLFPGLPAIPSLNSNVIEVRTRLFNTNGEQIVSAVGDVTNGTGHGAAVIEGTGEGSYILGDVFKNAKQLYGVSGDFLGTGLEEIVFASTNASFSQIKLQALAAANPQEPSDGVVEGQLAGPFSNKSNVYAIASGVFVDPQPGHPRPPAQVALLSTNPTGNNDSGLTLTLYSLDSGLNVKPTGKSLTLTLPSNETGNTLSSIALAAGRFTGGTHDQLVAAFFPLASLDNVYLITIDFDANGNPVQQKTYTTRAIADFPTNIYGPAVLLKTGRFDWFSQSEQVAMSVFSSNGAPPGGSLIEIVSFDSSLNPMEGSLYNTGNNCHFGLAVGRFDSMQANPNPPPAQQPNPNLQLSDYSTDCSTNIEEQATVNIYDVDPANNFLITLHSQLGGSDLAGASPDPRYPTALVVAMGAGDRQSRSVALGAPEKATVTGHIQPDTVLALPPMHVDWITPAGGTTPQVLNVSVFPATFNTAYSFQNGSSGSVTRGGTTSYTTSTKETASEKVSYGVPGIASVSLKSTQAASQMHKNTVSKQYNTYSGQSFGFSTATIFDDTVAATVSQFNIYSYRVLGQCITAANAPASEGCPPGTKPLYIQFSGPDNVNYIQAAQGRSLEWYQPVEEPGNIFSYPANLTQLQADIGGGNGFQALTPPNNIWDSQTNSSVTANWSQGNNNSVSSGSVSTHTFDASVSASAKVSFDGFGASVGLGFDYNQSASTSTMNQSTSSFSSSQGIKLNRGVGGGPISDAVYDYQGQSVIYGQLAPQGTVQNDVSPGTTVQTEGYIAAAHMADMLSQGSITSGNFWAQAYSAAPDIALNHPQRWLQKEPSGVNSQQVQFNCPVGFDSSLDVPSCTANQQTPNPANVADASFYQIKGLFVTPGDTTDGPQISNTPLGSKVNLRVRVYNYSLVNLSSTAKMHVQFYAQPWGIGEFKSRLNNPNAFAPAIFIGEGTSASGSPLVAVPAFCGGFTGGGDPCVGSGASVRNWEYAYTTWDTSKSNVTADSTWKFWVVVWVEDNGKLVAELPGHGLKLLPTGHFNSLADVPIETYSNNLGFYNQVFTILPATSIGATGQAKHLDIQNVGVRGEKVLRDVPITVTAFHTASGDNVDSVLALYYDGDPHKEGTLFDVQHISRVPLVTGYMDTASYTPKTCGPHTIVVESIPLDGSASKATARKKIDVTSDPVIAIDALIRYVESPGYPPRFRNAMLSQVKVARRSFTKEQTLAGTIQMDVLLRLVQGGAFFVPPDVRQAIADQIRDLLGCLDEPRDHNWR